MFLRRFKISQRLVAALLMIAIIPMFILGMTAISQSGQAIRSLVGTYSGQLAIQLGGLIENRLNIMRDKTTAITLGPLVQENLRNYAKLEKSETARLASDLKDAYQNSFVQDKVVLYFSVYNDLTRVDYGKLESYVDLGVDDIRAHMKQIADKAGGQNVWMVDRKGNLILCYTVKSKKNNKDICTALMVIDKSFLANTMSSVDLGDSAQVLLINESNTVISSNRTDVIQPGMPFEYVSVLSRIAENEARKQQDITYTNSVLENVKFDEDMYISYSRIPGTDWYIVAAIPNSALNRSSSSISSSILVTGAICAIFAIFLALFIATGITRPLAGLVRVMKKAESGELTLAGKEPGKDEISILTASFNNMILSIKTLIRRVHQSAGAVAEKTLTIASSADQTLQMSEGLSRALDEVANGASTQAEETVNSANMMVQLSEAINTVTENLDTTRDIINNILKLSRDASEIVKILNENADDANRASMAIAQEIKTLNDDMREIHKIVKMIASISEQTNMLALNASIEAARAGNAGLGFAVVAEEVKKLADQSKDASVEISNIIDRISKRTEMAVNTAETASDSMRNQLTAVRSTDKSFNTVSDAMARLAAGMKDIGQEVERMMQIKSITVNAIENISAISQETAARSQEASSNTIEQMSGAKELSRFAGELSAISEDLERSISQFRFSER